MLKTRHLNPKQRLVRHLREEIDLLVPQGAPLSREEEDAAGSARTRSQKKARKTPQDPPKAADGPTGSQGQGPIAVVDPTVEPPPTRALPPTPSQGAGRAGPKGLGKAQEGGKQQVDRQQTSLQVGQVTPDHWEDKLGESVGDPLRDLGEARSEVLSTQVEGEDFVF